VNLHARETNDKAMVGILAHGLRNDAGGELGRTAVVCDPLGLDERTDIFLQRKRGSVHVVVFLFEWWGKYGQDRLARPNVAVYCLVTGAGAILFANANPYVATVVPMTCVIAIWMRYPFGDHFSRAMRLGSNPEDWRVPLPKTQNRMVQHMGPGINPY
jgi:hypothetical protein